MINHTTYMIKSSAKSEMVYRKSELDTAEAQYWCESVADNVLKTVVEVR